MAVLGWLAGRAASACAECVAACAAACKHCNVLDARMGSAAPTTTTAVLNLVSDSEDSDTRTYKALGCLERRARLCSANDNLWKLAGVVNKARQTFLETLMCSCS